MKGASCVHIMLQHFFFCAYSNSVSSLNLVVSYVSNPNLEKWIALCQASTIRPVQLSLCELLEAGAKNK